MRPGRLLVSLVCTIALVSGCSLLNGSRSVVVPSSVAPSEVGATCPGVPTSSVELVSKGLSFESTMVREEGMVRNVRCFGYGGAKKMKVFYSHYGRNLTGVDVHDLSAAYRASLSREVFPVSGVEGATGEVLLGEDGGGSSIITCGDSFVLVSFYPRVQFNGDLKVGLRNLALSMVPWVCQGKPVPGLGADLMPAFPDGSTATSTSPDASGGAPSPTASESESGQ